MTSPTPHQIDPETISRILSKIGDDDVVIFNKEEADALREVAEFWLGWKAVGRFMGGVKKVLTFIGWAIAFWLALKAGAADWVRSVVK